MRDRRRVDELSIEELEQVLAMRKREARQQRLQRMRRDGRVIEQGAAAPPPTITEPQRVPEPAPAAVPSPAAPRTDRTLDDIIAHIAKNPGDPNAAVRFVDEDTGTIVAVTPVPQADAPAPPQPRPATNGRYAHQNGGKQRQKNTSGGEKITRATRRMTNALLLVVEVAAVFGLVYLGWELLQGIQILESRTTEAQEEIEAARSASVPTLAPTPMLTLDQVVLPGGHVYVEGQTPSLNIDEIPQNVRFAVADQITRPVINRPPTTSETALRLVVPKLNIDQTIVQGADWEALKQGVGQVINGYTPSDDAGNVALTAHNDIYGELFKDLDQLESGDQFQVQTREQVYLYEVTRTEVVKPTDVHVLQSVGKPTAVLISCYPYRVNSQRIVVFADRVG